jgi:pyruvate dehydrogenase E2 component (dihydrolipoamide acetyltransferase)
MMRQEVTMPRMGQSMDEGRVLCWLKEVGQKIERGDIIAQIETDKAVVEMEAFVTGTLVQVVVDQGDLVPIGSVIAYIDDGQPEVTLQADTPTAQTSSHGLPETLIPPGASTPENRTQAEGRINASPVARRLAKEHGIDLAQLKGTGPGGRIGKEDIDAWLQSQSQGQGQVIPVTEVGGMERIRLSKIKQTTARRMTESKATTPHFYVSMDIEMSQALAVRDWLKNQGRQVTINDLVLKATALALTEFPVLNSVFAGDEIHVHPHINLAVAVAIDDGLITPVIHKCESLSIVEMADASRRIIERARTGRLRQKDMADGTFTVTNLGMYGVKHFEAIVNPPQAAILTVGAVRRVPTFDPGDRIVPMQVITATVSADHRVTDGAEVARFLRHLQTALEGGFALASVT